MNTQTNRRLFHAALILFMAVSVLLAAHPQAAQAQDSEFTGSRTFLIAIPQSDLWNSELPAGLDRHGAARVARELLEKETDSLLRELSRLEAQGMRLETTVLDDLSAIRVTLAEGDVAALAGALPEGISLADAGAEAPACASPAGVDALANRVWATSQMLHLRAQHAPADSEALVDDSPKIIIFSEPEYDAYFVGGYVAPASEVKMRLLRGGVQVTVSYEVSYPDGFFMFGADYLPCNPGNYSWTLQAGDVVEIQAAGKTASMVYWPIKSLADPETDIVSGSGPANRVMEIDLMTYDPAAPCQWLTYHQSTVSDAAGKFSVDTSSLLDFNRSVGVLILSTDSNGHRLISPSHMYHLLISVPENAYSVDFTPDTAFTLVLKRGETIVETVNGTTNSSGNQFANFTATVQAGDRATATFAGNQLSYTVVEAPAITLDRTTGQLSGSGATPGMKIIANLEMENPIRTRCLADDLCQMQTVAANGLVSMNFGPLHNGELINLEFFSPEGERFQNVRTPVETYLAIDPKDNSVMLVGWPVGHITLTLKNNLNAVKETLEIDKLGIWNSWYYFSAPILVGDRIEATNGVITRTAVVYDLSAVRANFNTDRITGTASAGHLIASLETVTTNSCMEMDQATAGAFTFNPGIDIPGRSYATVGLRDSDGNYLIAWVRSWNVAIYSGDSHRLAADLETAGATLNWELKRGAGVIDSGTVSAAAGNYSVQFDFTAIPQAGDVLSLSTSDGNTETLVLPEFNAHFNLDEKYFYGTAPANQHLSVFVIRRTPNNSDGQSFELFPGASGSWSFHLNSDMSWLKCGGQYFDDYCYTLEADSTLANGFSLHLFDEPAGVTADAYEADDTSDLAVSYAGMQSHTLHRYDVDWVKFIVTADDVANATPFSIRVLNTGLDIDMVLELYGESNLTVPMASTLGEYTEAGGQPPSFDWTFTSPGTYYVKISSPNESGYCSSRYTLWILRDPQTLYLPIIGR